MTKNVKSELMKAVDSEFYKNKKPNLRTRLRFVTPQAAEKLLKLNSKLNRNISRARVEMYKWALRTGQWTPNHQGVGINCDGSLLDGQHRLLAIIETGIGAWMNVTTGVPVEAMDKVDNHFARSAVDGVAIVHERRNVSRRDMAAVKYVETGGIERGMLTCERVSIYIKYEKPLLEVKEFFAKGDAGVARAAVMAPIIRAWLSKPAQRARIKRFVHLLANGAEPGNFSDVDKNATQLREALLNPKKMAHSVGGSRQKVCYLKTSGALVRFLEDQPAQKALLAATDECFPLPGEEK